MSEAVLDSTKSGHDEHHSHPPHLQHHFDTEEQQFDASKIGMWLFLATEILLFGGLFCAYAVYRANHPEIFMYAHQYLDVTLGGINTAVLIFSSLTMAWAVRLSQLGKRTGLIVCLAITLFCGFMFLGIKYVEYKHKWEHGLLWGTNYTEQSHYGDSHGGDDAIGASASGGEAADSGEVSHGGSQDGSGDGQQAGAQAGQDQETENATAAESGSQDGSGEGQQAGTQAGQTSGGEENEFEITQIPQAADGPQGLAAPSLENDTHGGNGQSPKNVHIFFGIYFAMTGLHGLHVIVGMIAIGWVLYRAARGHFDNGYFTPVDLTGLYWHLVDLIWIYLFPLLYLIH